MHEFQPGGPGGDYRPQHGRAGQPEQPDQLDQRPGDDWFRPQRGQPREPGPREPGPRDLPAVYDGPRNLPASRPVNLPASRPLNLPVSRPADRPRFHPFLRVTSVDLMALNVHEECKPGGNWALIAGTVFFLADTILMADGFTRPVPMGSRVLVIFIWLVSVAVVALLWLRGSPRFSGLFKQRPLAGVTRARTGSHSRRGNAAAR
jgi:hypothetical protein